jgi:formylmethanofuran dehydrogenase subunit E
MTNVLMEIAEEGKETKAIIPQDAVCYKCGCIAMRREIDNKGYRTGKYLCIPCYGQFLCIRNR